MYDALYAILNKSEKATLQVLNEKYLLKTNNVFQTSSKIRRTPTNLSLSMFELCSVLCLKHYSLNFAIVHAQKRLLCLSEFVILVLH